MSERPQVLACGEASASLAFAQIRHSPIEHDALAIVTESMSGIGFGDQREIERALVEFAVKSGTMIIY